MRISCSWLIETAGLIAYRTDDKKYKDNIVVYFSEFLSVYKSVLNSGDILRYLKKLEGRDKDKKVIITDKTLIKMFNDDELDVENVDNVIKL